MSKSEAAKAKSDADRVVCIDDLDNILRRVAAAMISEYGYYTYTDSDTGDKVFVEAS